MQRAYYFGNIKDFKANSPNEILGEIVRNNEFDLDLKQRNTWEYEIKILQRTLSDFPVGDIAFEYTIPRIGDRIDVVLSINGIIFLLEFKVGEKTYPKDAIEQVVDYALDLKYFHKGSRGKKLIPILICTKASDYENEIVADEDFVYKVIRTNEKTLPGTLKRLVGEIAGEAFSFQEWINSQYMPTPTIIEAAQALYHGHNVKEISRSDSGAYNLGITSDAINRIINRSKTNGEKSICFVTGVPGAGKTLAGLNIANERHNFDENEHAVFLSGNGPLVSVLREALARDEYERSIHKVRKVIAKKQAKAFIQNIHHFRDDALKTEAAPIEKVTVFDEAQRAWTMQQTAKFMAKRGEHNWLMSEPKFLISVMDRHSDWAVIVCLVGGGQEINTGEAGLPEWFTALKSQFSHWKVYISKQISDVEYTRGTTLNELLNGLHSCILDELHLAVSLRSFRDERVSEFVKSLLDINEDTARRIYRKLRLNYPILMTRTLQTAREWVRTKARGSERYGLIASSSAKRLRSFGIWVQSSIKAEDWFLNEKDDIRSSFFLEDTATEFDIQGLEIDWTIVAWDANFRIKGNEFVPYNFTGTKWCNIKKEGDRLYLKNAYRVLLTRARQGMIIFIPEGNDEDATRKKIFYDSTYEYFQKIGIEEI